jgi:HEAT repeat protein
VEARAGALALIAATAASLVLSVARAGRPTEPEINRVCTYRTYERMEFDRACAEPAQDDDAKPESELDKMLRLAREASPVVRPQAARRFVGLGAEAAQRVRAVTGGTPAGYAALGLDLLEALGELDDAAVRADLWKALDDRDFPWRPSAARTLAKTVRDGEEARFRGVLRDAVGPVRAAGVLALAALGARDALPDRRGAFDDVRARLADADDRVRREAATAIDAWGDPSALWWLVEELKRTDRFFDLDTGRLARFDAAGRLERRLGDSFGFAPERPPTGAENQAALARIAARVTELAGGPPELPRVAQAAPDDRAEVHAVLGLEVRSCRRGEYFARWDPAGTLWVGTGNARPIALPAGAAEGLAHRAAELAAKLGEEEFWGEPGCDVEVYYLQGAGGVRALRVAKGPAAVEDLRPAPLGELAAALLASLPAEAADLRAELAAALGAVGGAVGSAPK